MLDLKDPLSRARGWIYPADLAVDQGQYTLAVELYTTALRDFERVGIRASVDWVAKRLGIVAIRMGDHRRGVRILTGRHEIDALALAGLYRSSSTSAVARSTMRASCLVRRPLLPSPHLVGHSRSKTRCWKRCR